MKKMIVYNEFNKELTFYSIFDNINNNMVTKDKVSITYYEKDKNIDIQYS